MGATVAAAGPSGASRNLPQDLRASIVVFAPPTPPPPFDYHIPLMSVPHVLGTELANIPADVPYVRVDPAKARQWAGESTEAD